MLRLFITSSVLLAASALLGCSGGGDFSVRHQPTFHEDVEPIVQRSCQSCHTEGGLAPFALQTYEEARAMVGPMVQPTGARTMPPWGTQEDEECQPAHGWKHDARLTDEEIDTIAAWQKAGMPEGDRAKAPPPPEVVGDSLPGVQQELA